MNQRKRALPKTNTLHHEENLACASFPYSIRTSSLQKTKLNHERNLMLIIFPSMMKGNIGVSPFPTTMLYHEVKDKFVSRNNIAL